MIWKAQKQPSSIVITHLKSVLGVGDTIATLLAQRGITTFEEAQFFFRPNWEQLHNPFLMKDMHKAVQRINKALESNEKILVFGDYDVDGTTAVALMSSFLKTKTPHIATYIPDRYKEGYGISKAGIDFAHQNGFSLIIALDCGIKSVELIDYANTLQIDFIICDHHTPGEKVPNAVAVLNPKQIDCAYPYKELCGCGVGFKLAQALTPDSETASLIPYLDLVATAIAADIVPITGENRTLAYLGMQVVNHQPRAGITALLQSKKAAVKTISDLVFTAAPRINAAGRIHHGQYAVDLLTKFTADQATETALLIENWNEERKGLDQQITQEALLQIEENKEENTAATVVYHPNWHKGVIGIVASRLIETYYRPTLVFTKNGDYLAASARSVAQFDVYNALEACREHILQFGGHQFAAGLTLLPEQYLPFKAKFEEVVAATLPKESKTEAILYDLELNLNDITPKFIRIIKQFEPFGPGNMSPLFLIKNLKDTGYGKNIGNDGAHLKLFVKQNEMAVSAIGFNLGKTYKSTQLQQGFDAICTIEENYFNGTTSLQLNIRDLKLYD